MARVKRYASSLLLAAGIVLVFTGLSAALGFSLPGMIASVAVISMLLYAGSVWFAPFPPAIAPSGADTVIVFDRSLHVAAGASAGTPLVLQFPEPLRARVEEHCRAALRGEYSHFSGEIDGRQRFFDVAPVPTVSGMVAYGVLVSGAGMRVAVPASEPATMIA